MDGDEPDPRFTLANERTFLTWLSTSLALCAGGVAMAAVPPHLFVPWVQTTLAVVLVLLSAVAAAFAYPRWRKVQTALRRAEPSRRRGSRPCSDTGWRGVAVLALVLILVG